jgi:hypothetical protein
VGKLTVTVSVYCVDENAHIKTVSFSAEYINGRCPSAPILFMVFPSKQFHFIMDTSTTKLTVSVNVSGMVWSDSNLQPVAVCMVLTVPTAPNLLGLE